MRTPESAEPSRSRDKSLPTHAGSPSFFFLTPSVSSALTTMSLTLLIVSVTLCTIYLTGLKLELDKPHDPHPEQKPGWVHPRHTAFRRMPLG